MNRIGLTILTILICAVPLRAGNATQQSPQTEAAIADARESLQHQILTTTITRGLTVRELLDRTGGGDELTKRLNAVQQIGGTRWLDDQTAQVRLVVEGGAIADLLNKIVGKDPSKSPLPPEVIHSALSEWRNRTYSATGTSTGPADVTRLQPPAGDAAWAMVPVADRNRALLAARDNAISLMIASLRPIQAVDGQTMSGALEVPEVGAALNGWLANRPITSVEFRDDLSARVVMSVPPEELWGVLHAALAHQKTATMPATESGWSLLQKQVISRLAPPIGVGVVQVAKGGVQIENLLPDFAPPWAAQQCQAEATAQSKGSKLHTARAAEALAMEKLQTQVEALKLRDNLTVGEAANRDPKIERAVAKALGRAHPYQVDYGQASVTVKVTFNLSDLWTLISERR